MQQDEVKLLCILEYFFMFFLKNSKWLEAIENICFFVSII